MKNGEIQEFLRVLKTFDEAMLVTRRGEELRSRPMVIADRTDSGHVWFVTSVDSAKLEELTEYRGVNVSMQDSPGFLSISGTTRATRDRAKIDEVWKASYGLWFDKGRDDPELILLEVLPHFAEYWDRSGVEAISFMFAAARSALTGKALDDQEGSHGKIKFAGGDAK